MIVTDENQMSSLRFKTMNSEEEQDSLVNVEDLSFKES